jgi:hypothetical protein
MNVAHVQIFCEDLLANSIFYFFICIVGGWSPKLGPLGTSTTYCHIVPALGDCENGEFGGMNDGGN